MDESNILISFVDENLASVILMIFYHKQTALNQRTTKEKRGEWLRCDGIQLMKRIFFVKSNWRLEHGFLRAFHSVLVREKYHSKRNLVVSL